MKHLLLPLALAAALTVHAAEPATKSGALIDFRIDVQRPVANDLGRATAYAELTGSDPGDVAQKTKSAIADGLAVTKSVPGVTVKSGGTQTWPIYHKNGRTIESWRMRSEIVLESRDPAALSLAVGKLSGTLAIGSLSFSPAAETRRKVEEDASTEAIEAFRAKAERIAATLNKPYRIRQISIGSNGYYPPPRPQQLRAAAMMAEAAPMPTEAGESNITVNVSGQIELID